MNSTDSYLDEVYQPLSKTSPEIRLLTLLPGSNPQPITCALNICSLDQAPPYSALSYEWGTAGPRESIEINGRPLRVTPSLYGFLSKLRHPHAKSMLWADAICINQKNLEERSQQVSFMGRIYSKADQVLAWLGEASDRSDEVLDLVAPFPTHPGVPLDNDRGKNDFFLALCQQRLAVPFRLMLERTYWSRVWILQEVVLAKSIKVHCGFKSALLDTFKRYGIETPLWLSNGAMLPGSGRLFDPRDLEVEESAIGELHIVETALRTAKDTAATLEQRERPWPVFSIKGSSRLHFTFSRSVGMPHWEIEGLVEVSQKNQTSSLGPLMLNSYGPCSFEQNVPLFLDVTPEGIQTLVKEIIGFYLGTYRPRAGSILRRRYSGGDRSFKALCMTSMRLACTDIRDHIYGLLGLVDDPNTHKANGNTASPTFLPDYKWTPSELLLRSLNHFRPARTMDTAVLVARFLGLYSPGYTDSFLDFHKTMTLAERCRHSVVLSATPLVQKQLLIDTPIQDHLHSYRAKLKATSGIRQMAEENFVLHLPDGRVIHDPSIFKIDNTIHLLATPSRAGDKNYQGIGIAVKIDKGSQVSQYATFLQGLADYLPAVLIDAGEAPNHWPYKRDVLVQMPFYCFFSILTSELCRENAFIFNLGIDHRAPVNASGAPTWL